MVLAVAVTSHLLCTDFTVEGGAGGDSSSTSPIVLVAPGIAKTSANRKHKGAVKTSRPVDARLCAAGEDPQDYKIRIGREYTRPNGGRQEHAAS